MVPSPPGSLRDVVLGAAEIPPADSWVWSPTQTSVGTGTGQVAGSFLAQ